MDAQKLLETLQDLTGDELDLFKFHMHDLPENILGGLRPIGSGALEEANTRQKVVNLIMKKYPNDAQEIVMNVLRKIPRNDLVNDLENIPRASGVERPQSIQATASRAVVEKVPRSTQATGVDTSGKTVGEVPRYELNSKPTGLCVIMHNENFPKNPKAKRNGTDKDADDLARTFSLLGFRVLMCKDQTMGKMQESLKRFSSKDLTELQGSSVKEWSGGAFTDLNVDDVPQHGDAFVCCIMSHGDKGYVSGTDGNPLLVDDITTTFNGKGCPVLLDKPKLFFIQACQGKDIQCGITADSSPGLPEAPKTPVDADFLVFMATTENYLAFKSTNGSWFMQSLCKQLEEGSHEDRDLMVILTAVNKEMADKKVSLDQVDAKLAKQMKDAGQEEGMQMSVIRYYTLRKSLMFTPISK